MKKDRTCYAQGGPLAMHWRAVSQGERGVTFEEFTRRVAMLAAGTMFRHNQAGDLPGRGEQVATRQLEKLSEATAHLIAFTYTHKQRPEALKAIKAANSRAAGIVVNLSADSLSEADALADTRAGPVCVVVPQDAKPGSKTPAGRTVAICPAQLSEKTTCHSCGNGSPLCARRNRQFIVGFRAHGQSSRRLSQAVG
jgi:hypothetical protein